METLNKNSQKQYVALQEPLAITDVPLDEENPQNSINVSVENPDIAKQRNVCETYSFLIYLKYMDNSQKEIDISQIMDQKILELQKLAFPQNFADETKTIRLIYQGKLLNTEDNINSCNFQKGGFVHAVINEKVSVENDNSNSINIPPAINNHLPENSAQNEALQIMNLIIEAQNVRRNPNNPVVNDRLNRIPSLRNLDNEQNWLFIMGGVFGYFLSIWAIIIMFVCKFPERARSGVTFGFCIHILVKILNGI